MNACTLWPDRWWDYDLSGCCLMHDEAFDNKTGFLAANKNLRE